MVVGILVGLAIVGLVGYSLLDTSGAASTTLRTIDRGVKETTHNVNSTINEIMMEMIMTKNEIMTEMRETKNIVTKEVQDIANLIKVFVIVITLLVLYMIYTMYITSEHLGLQTVYCLFCFILVSVLMTKLVKILIQICYN